MRAFKSRWTMTVGALAIVASGAAGGALFGDTTKRGDEERLVLRASRIVNLLVDWLPDDNNPADIVYNGIDGMLEVLDPHSNFLDPRSFQRMRARQEGSFFGVGIIISRREGKVTVIAPIAGTPAAAKGLRAGDVIAKVEGEATDNLTLDEVVDRVRGPEGSSVHLTIERPGLKEPLEIQIDRTRIPTNSVRFAFMLRPDIGYIRLSEFSNTSVHEVREAIRDLESQGMTQLVFDLRNNPGGGLEAAVGVADTFLRPGQVIVTTKGRKPENDQVFRAPGRGTHFNGPLVILVNEGSASASEIVAGAVQDHDRGLVLGETTWGKGLVQTVFTVRDTGLALTTARYYTPSGRCIQRDYASYIDYITHRNGITDDTAPKNEVFETDAGRTVLGGGGITPDVTVKLSELPEPVVRLYGQSAFFRFAVELLQKVPTADQAAFGRGFSVDDLTLQRFWKFVRDNSIVDEATIEAAQSDGRALEEVRRAVQVEVLNSTIGLEAGYREAIEGDDQIRAAVEYMGEAADMWSAWQTPETPTPAATPAAH